MILSSSVLAGKKGSKVVAFIIFMILSMILGTALDHIPVLKSAELTFTLYPIVTFVIAATVLYDQRLDHGKEAQRIKYFT